MAVAPGDKFGRLTVEADAGRCSRGRLWKCRCVCGNTVVAYTYKLTSGNTRSCGCSRVDPMCAIGEWNVRHGEARRSGRTAEYRCWRAMRDRCHRPGSNRYRQYGARGITVCDRWHSFENFLADMGRKPGPSYSIERINNNGNYEPTNCKWATAKEQARNRRRLLETTSNAQTNRT